MNLLVLAPLLVIAGVLYAAHDVLRDWLRLHRAWGSGLVAEGRCLRTYTSTRCVGEQGRDHTVRHHVYEFMTADGRVVRFAERGGPVCRIAGDFVTVYYSAGATVAATAVPPRPVRQAVSTLGMLGFLGVVAMFAAFVLAS
ncbi:hypothetical protein [Streptomyces sp. FZ201]|uniref:hypothetical protein n=1 Tax=Streptomyces sp. FZ201 TaxID=3057122 RepID=UPI0021C21DFC|nr:hypothetical protein [Streptomyces sp. FZ201]